MKGSSFIKAWNLRPSVPSPISGHEHNRHQEHQTNTAFPHPGLSVTGSTDPNPILKATQDSPVKLKKWWRRHGRLAIPFGYSDAYSEPPSIWWGNVYRINANWCIKDKPCLPFLWWSGNTGAHQTLEAHKVHKMKFKTIIFTLFLLL